MKNFHFVATNFLKKVLKKHVMLWKLALQDHSELEEIILEEIPAQLLLEIFEFLEGKRAQISPNLLKEFTNNVWNRVKIRKKEKTFSQLADSELFKLLKYLPEGELRIFH